MTSIWGTMGREWLLICSLAGVTQAASLGDATPYNIFAFDSVSYSNTSISNGVAAGNSITLTNMFTAVDVTPAGNTSVEVVSGGTADLSNGTVNGSVQYAANPSSNTATLSPGATFSQAPSPYNFPGDQQAYQAYSNQLAALTTNGTVTNAFGTVTFSGGPSAGLYVFTLTNAESTANNLIVDLPTGSTALFNFAGSASYNYGGFSTLNGLDAADLLWNGPSATSVTIGGVAFLGSILTPNAHVDLTNGNLTGQVVANSVVGASTKLSYAQFDGAIPPAPSTVPEAPSIVTAALGIVLIAISRFTTHRGSRQHNVAMG